MSLQYAIVVGDPTEVGGEALTGMTDHRIQCLDGNYSFLVCIGDSVLCGQCGMTTVAEGYPGFFTNKPAAYHGCKLACGHRMVATPQRLLRFEVAEPQSKSRAYASSSSNTESPSPDNRPNKKQIKRIFWTYGSNESALDDQSRFSPDLTLRIETENYVAGERIKVKIETSDGQHLSEDRHDLTLSAVVGSDGTARIRNPFCGLSLSLHIDESGVQAASPSESP
jgi:uncharacterized Zn-binding protein involved in type VI secretion